MKITPYITRRVLLKLALPILTCATTSCGGLVAQAQSASHVRLEQQTAKKAATPATPAAQDPGERKFQENCGRCHTAPEQLSPRITGTVVRHMRVRALLSAEDERDILRYLSP